MIKWCSEEQCECANGLCWRLISE
uniref:Uncharacterized protein n=1 Tax=Arundo donax TaxID=35708 RepID=A0A0A9FXU8_ARUDO